MYELKIKSEYVQCWLLFNLNKQELKRLPYGGKYVTNTNCNDFVAELERNLIDEYGRLGENRNKKILK
jgi:hypothetical protein